MVREVEQQLLLYNIFISHQLAALQVRPEEIVRSGEVAAGRWQMERGSMVIFIFPTRGLAEGDHVLVLTLSGGKHLPTGRKPYQYLILFYRTQVRPVVGLVKNALSDLLITLSLTKLTHIS